MLVDTQRPHCVACGRDLPDRVILPDIPQLHLSVPRPADQLPEPTTLHVHVGDPLLVLSPTSNHGQGRLLAGIEDADDAVAVASAKDVASDLVGGQGGYTGAGAGRDVLLLSSVSFSSEPRRNGHTLVQISVAAFHTLMTLTSPATNNLPWPCCQSRTSPAFLLLGTMSESARKEETNSTSSDS